jgi:hypothetical protein
VVHTRVADGGDRLHIWKVAASSHGQLERSGPPAWRLVRFIGLHVKNGLIINDPVKMQGMSSCHIPFSMLKRF